MTEHEAVSILKNLGWSCKSDEVGDRFCTKSLEGRVVLIIPSIGKRPDHFQVSFMPSVSTKPFTAAVAFILGETSDHDPIIVNNDLPEKIAYLSLEDVERLSQWAIAWANDLNIEKGMAVYSTFPTNCKGARPLRHLAALAIAGDEDRLLSYQRSFEQGDRLDFVPYITTEMIERALLLARDKEK